MTAAATASTCGSSSRIRFATSRCSSRASATRLGTVIHDRRRPDDADVVAERGVDDVDRDSRGPHRVLEHPRARGAEELLAGARDAAADDDELRLEQDRKSVV